MGGRVGDLVADVVDAVRAGGGVCYGGGLEAAAVGKGHAFCVVGAGLVGDGDGDVAGVGEGRVLEALGGTALVWGGARGGGLWEGEGSAG